MDQNIKVISINSGNSKFDNLLSSRDKIKDILKKKIEDSNKKKVSFEKEENLKHQAIEDKFLKQFNGFRDNRTKKKPVQEKIDKRVKTRKEYFNKPEPKPLIPNKNVLTIFQKILMENNIPLTIKFIKTITRNQLILILCSLDVIEKNTKAPTPLLKNLLYNFITSTIHIIK